MCTIYIIQRTIYKFLSSNLILNTINRYEIQLQYEGRKLISKEILFKYNIKIIFSLHKKKKNYSTYILINLVTLVTYAQLKKAAKNL